MGTDAKVVEGRDSASLDARVLVLAATARDAALAESVLSSSGISVTICPDLDAIVEALGSGASALLLAEESLSGTRTAALSRALAEQPPWSDPPVLVLARPGADSSNLGDAVRSLGNVTVLERPLRVATLVSSVRTALRARERQYQIRDNLAERVQVEELLRRSDQRKDEFLATLGHELRNPLAPLTTGLHLLKAIARTDPDVARVTALMERQVTHLTRLVDDLLEVSRITRGVVEVQREPIDIWLVVLSAAETCRPALNAAGHELILAPPSESLVVAGDAMRLTQVFANLLGNAVKYTNPGGRIELGARRENDGCVVSVLDNGIGIPPDQLGAVFEMFTQVDRSNRRSQGGLGIGLTLVRSLVELHGGRVEARTSSSGGGTEFLVHLPLMREEYASPGSRTTEPLADFPPRRVLVVDDNADAADSLGSLLHALGATVSVCHSGHAALAALEAFHPEAVLLDIGMPGMDGYEVARRIRADSAYRGIILIALTGWGQEEDQQRSTAAGFSHHMTKPPDLHTLRELLAKRAGVDE